MGDWLSDGLDYPPYISDGGGSELELSALADNSFGAEQSEDVTAKQDEGKVLCHLVIHVLYFTQHVGIREIDLSPNNPSDDGSDVNLEKSVCKLTITLYMIIKYLLSDTQTHSSLKRAASKLQLHRAHIN